MAAEYTEKAEKTIANALQLAKDYSNAEGNLPLVVIIDALLIIQKFTLHIFHLCSSMKLELPRPHCQMVPRLLPMYPCFQEASQEQGVMWYVLFIFMVIR